MSANYDMDYTKFIIKRDDSTTDFFRKWDEFLASAKAERLLDYLTGKTHVKPEADVEALNKPRLSFFQTALIKQTKHDEASLTQQIWQEIIDNELYAYLYAAPINALDQNFPTQEEINDSRPRILYNSNAYLAYLYKENKTELPVNDAGRDAQCQSIRPGKTSSDTDPTTSMKSLKLRTSSESAQVVGERLLRRRPT